MYIEFDRFVDILRENGESGDIKECPLCQVLIMREAGCAQMMCGHCKHIFCWHCRKSLDVSNHDQTSQISVMLSCAGNRIILFPFCAFEKI